MEYYIQLNELYIGKDPILPLQNQFTIIRNKIKGKSFSTSINVDKEILKFNRMVEKLFGFSSFALNISPDQTINAYTWGATVFKSKEELKRMINSLKASATTGFYHDSSSGLVTGICTLNMGLINNDNFTDEEVIACILHEIGHNFFQAVTDKDCVYSLTFKIIKILSEVNKKINNNIINTKDINYNIIKQDIDNIVKSFDLMGQLNNLFSKVKNRLFTIPHAISNTAKNVMKYVSSKFFRESMEDNMRRTRYSYTNEKFADSFAVMYGYGIELHSFLQKISAYYMKELNIKESRNSVIIAYKVFDYMLKDAILYMMNLMDEHPKNLARIKVSIEYVKRELAKEGLDPKVKLELMNQVNEMQKLIDDYINFPKDEDNIAVRRAYYRELYKKFGGDRREQDTDNEALFSTIDKRFDEILKDK